MKISIPFTVLLCQFLASAGLRAATYYVATNGNNSNPGTQSQPFLSVQKGVDTARAGDSVLVGSGVYAENVLALDNAGTAESPITINGQNLCTIGSFAFGKPYVNLINLTIKGGTNLWKGLLYVGQTGSHCIVSNVMFDAEYKEILSPLVRWDGPDAAPYGTAGSYNLFISNTVQNAKAEMIFRVFGDTNTFYGNRAINCDATDFMQGFGRGQRIIANTVSNFFDSGTHPNHVDFFQTFPVSGMFGSKGHLIESNYVTGMSGLAQLGNLTTDGDFQEVRDIMFRNNVFVGVSAKISIAIPEVKFYNNVFYRCATNAENGGPLLIFADAGSLGKGHSGQVFNNVFLDCGTAGNTTSANGWYCFDLTLTNVTADYNYVGKDGYKAMVTDPQHRLVGNPGGWDKFSWWEAHGINGGNPMLVNELQLDFHLRQGSPLIGRALPLNQLFGTDIRGLTRGTQWDIGAYEFQAGEAILLAPPGRLRPQ